LPTSQTPIIKGKQMPYNSILSLLKNTLKASEIAVLEYLLEKRATSEKSSLIRVSAKKRDGEEFTDTDEETDANNALEQDYDASLYDSESLPLPVKESKLYKHVYDYLYNIVKIVGTNPNPQNYIFNFKDAKYIAYKARQFDDNLNFYGPWQDNTNLLRPITFKKFVNNILNEIISDLDARHNYEMILEFSAQLSDLYNDFYMSDVMKKDFDLSDAMKRVDNFKRR
jgi:hypothetical protein